MKLKNKISTMIGSLITTLTTVVASPGHDEGTTTGMMWSDGGTWMHTGGHMTGYNMWGMGWFGLIPGLIFWTLAILGIIYLYQQITENEGDKE